RSRRADRTGRRGAQAVASEKGGGGPAGYAADREQLPRGRRGLARRHATAVRQRVQSPTRPQRPGPHNARSRGAGTMTTVRLTTRVIGAPIDRLDGPDKVKGSAPYAFEQSVDRPAYLYPLQATIVTGRITGLDGGAATAEPGVLALLTHANALRLAVRGGPGPGSPQSAAG